MTYKMIQSMIGTATSNMRKPAKILSEPGNLQRDRIKVVTYKDNKAIIAKIAKTLFLFINWVTFRH